MLLSVKVPAATGFLATFFMVILGRFWNLNAGLGVGRRLAVGGGILAEAKERKYKEE